MSQRRHWLTNVQHCLDGCLADQIFYAYMLPGTTTEAQELSWRVGATRELHNSVSTPLVMLADATMHVKTLL